MTQEQILIELTPIIAIYLPEDIQEEAIKPDSDLTMNLNINSAHLVDIVLDVEDHFNVEFANEDMEKLRTVNDAVGLIYGKLG